MPIHDQGYRRYAGTRLPHGHTWWVIARAGLVERLRERKFLGLLLVAWLPFFFYAVMIYVAANIPQAAAVFEVSPARFRDFFDVQSAFVFFITIYVGSGLLANDRRANALQIYLSKPLTRVDYITGKLVTLLIFLVGVTWLPAMLLVVLQTLFAGNFTFLKANLFIIPAITVFAAIQVLWSAFAMLALSSLSKNRRFVAMMYAGLIFFTLPMYQVLRQITGSRMWALISPEDVLDAIAAVLFRIPGTPAVPLPLALLVVSAMIGASIWVLERRIRGVEVVI